MGLLRQNVRFCSKNWLRYNKWRLAYFRKTWKLNANILMFPNGIEIQWIDCLVCTSWAIVGDILLSRVLSEHLGGCKVTHNYWLNINFTNGFPALSFLYSSLDFQSTTLAWIWKKYAYKSSRSSGNVGKDEGNYWHSSAWGEVQGMVNN